MGKPDNGKTETVMGIRQRMGSTASSALLKGKDEGKGMKVWKLLKTKTFWINAVGGALLIVNDLNGKIIPTEAATTALVVLNMVNRLLTTKPVSEK